MKIRNLMILTVLMIPLGAVAFAQGMDSPDLWETVGTGIEFQKFRLTDPVPVNIFVARMDRNNQNAIIESSIAQGRLSGGIEPVSKMADRYDQALNYWGPPTDSFSHTWGTRNDVIVAINGFYYGDEVEPPGVPWNGQIHSGWYAKRYTDRESLSGFVWKMDRSTFIGECISHPIDKQVVFIENGEDDPLYLDGLNVPRGDDELILYTPQYDSDTGTNASGIELLIEMEQPTSISEINASMPKGVIREIRNNQGSTPIPFDHVVLSAHGAAATELRSTEVITVGRRVGIAQKVKDCIPAYDWTYAYAGVGGQFYFLRNGNIPDYSENGQANAKDPRTAIAYNDQYIFFIVADGRDPGISEGISIPKLAAFAKDILGAKYGIAQDGGGSSTMVINGRLVNRPFNPEWCKFLFMPFVLNGAIPQIHGMQMLAENHPESTPQALTPDIKPTSDSIHQTNPESAQADYPHMVCERHVANGMMMVVVEPMEKSETYSPGSLVAITAESDVYLGPGTNYGIRTSLPSGSLGEVAAHGNDLNGVLAKGTNWWQVDFGDQTGWVNEALLTIQLKSAPADWRESVKPDK